MCHGPILQCLYNLRHVRGRTVAERRGKTMAKDKKFNDRCAVRALSLVAVLLVSAVFFPANAGVGSVIWTDSRTGFAIAGFDPVAYFADGVARKGLATFEHEWAGATWRFANEGNLAAFMEAPHVFAPRFGGFGAVSVARGHFASSDPHVWMVYKGNLLLFHSPVAKSVWQRSPDRFMAEAAGAWTDKLAAQKPKLVLPAAE